MCIYDFLWHYIYYCLYSTEYDTPNHPMGKSKPRYDPIGPFPGMGKPNHDHLRKPGPRGFGPGGMF